jgi:flagellar biosynthesis protein FlhF
MKILAFMGTTGVGKTTTVAKLAALYALAERRRVGIVTVDANRIAASLQLQTYGQILRVPVVVAQDRAEIVCHLSTFRDEGMDLVLIDTPGRSPNDMIPLGETAYLFDGMGAIQRIMTLSATSTYRDMEHSVGRFLNMWRPDAIALTRLDEVSDSTCFGRLLTLQAKYGLPLSYVTTGQKVPDDIASPDPQAIAARILV